MNIWREGASELMTDEDFILSEIQRFKLSRRRAAMLNGIKYYEGKHDILARKRTAIGKDGKLEPVDNLPNARIVDNQYRKMVNQKNSYLLGQPITVSGNNTEYVKRLQELFGREFQRKMLNIGKDAHNCGIGWLYVGIDNGEISLKRLSPVQVIPEWKDDEHTELDCLFRFYPSIRFEGRDEKIIEHVEIYTHSGIDYYEIHDGKLLPVEPFHSDYIRLVSDDTDDGYNWETIPIVPFKLNDDEAPLISRVKCLQDGLNLIESNFQNAMEEDPRNTIIVLVNYDGEDLGEFRRNLATYSAVKVHSESGGNGGDVRTLSIEVNADNYKAVIEMFKKAIIENAMGYDAKDDRLAGNANQMNIQSMYSDIDLDANGTEVEFQAAFEQLLRFVNAYLYNIGESDYSDERVEIIFNRDMLMNETEIIANCQSSVGLLSEETIIANHPWVDDIKAEKKRLEKEKKAAVEDYGGAFGNKTVSGDEEQ